MHQGSVAGRIQETEIHPRLSHTDRHQPGFLSSAHNFQCTHMYDVRLAGFLQMKVRQSSLPVDPKSHRSHAVHAHVHKIHFKGHLCKSDVFVSLTRLHTGQRWPSRVSRSLRLCCWSYFLAICITICDKGCLLPTHDCHVGSIFNDKMKRQNLCIASQHLDAEEYYGAFS